MNQQLCVLLWSKYSPQSKQLLQFLEQSPINLQALVGLVPICVDNKAVRNRILNDTTTEINSVPCVLNVFSDGTAEKYEGTQAVQWCQEMVRKYAPPPPPPPQQPRNQVRFSQPNPSENTEISENYDSDDTEEEPVPKKQRKKSKGKNRKQRKKKASKNQPTAIDDVISGSDDEMKSRPPVAVHSGANSYDFTDDFGTMEQPGQVDNTKSKAAREKSAGIMDAVAAMQKERDAMQVHRPGAPEGHGN